MEDPKIVILNEDGKVDEKAMRKQKLKQAFDKTAEWTKGAASKAWEFVKDKENREVLVTVGGAIVGGLIGLKKYRSANNAQLERDRIDHTYYDPQTGAHWELRRKLTNDERAELMARRRRGEFTEDILDDMRVLK